MPFKTFNAGDVLTAADVNDYLMEQAVITCTSGTRPSSPAEGMTIYETDTDKILSYSGSAWIPVQYQGAWDTYTPTWTASGSAPSIGNGSLAGRYMRAGSRVTLTVKITTGSTTTYGSGTYGLSLPPGLNAASGVPAYVGSGYFRDASATSTGHFSGISFVDPGGSAVGFFYNNSQVGAGNPFTWTNGDFLIATITYEAA